MIDLNSTTAFADRVNFFIDAAIDAQQDERRTYLGASFCGEPCERKTQYMYLAAQDQIERQKFPARVKRIFERGHVFEAMCRKWLSDAGFVFGKPGPGFSDFDGKFQGHEDGVICGWDSRLGGDTCPVALPAVWEHKAMKDDQWKKLQKEKLKKFSSTYYGQVTMEMHYMKVPRTLFSATNANTLEIYHEMISYDVAEAEMIRAKVSRVFTATKLEELLPRCTTDPAFYLCVYCPFRKPCWA